MGEVRSSARETCLPAESESVKSGARWIIRTDAGKSLVLKVPDPTKIVVVGSSHKDVGCGPQRPAAHVSVEYAAGELKVVRFQ